jgi:hypothetical protein
MKQTEKDILNKYAELKTAMKGMEAEEKLLKSEVLDIMLNNEVEQVELIDWGTLTLNSKRSWKYSPEVADMTTQLKEQKVEEERLGVAKYTENHFTVFKGIKNDEK